MSTQLQRHGGGAVEVAPPNGGSMISVEQSRAIEEVQAALVIAKRFPRDEIMARQQILEACKRPALAKSSVYSFPRGGQMVEGPSIRLAEVLARYWGNIAYGIRELERVHGGSKMEAFAWDQQSNTRITRQFDVAHVRDTKKGSYAITDGRDVYEVTANQGARRLRACILSVVPGYIVDEALEQCQKTLAGASAEPIEDRTMKLVNAFSELGVSRAMIEARLGHKAEVVSEFELVELRKIYNAIRDEIGKREDYFDVAAGYSDSGKTKTQSVREKLAARADREMAPADVVDETTGEVVEGKLFE